MFLPLRDNNPRLLRPYVVYTLIVANISFYLVSLFVPLENMGLWKERLLSGSHLGFIELFTYQFVHGGWAHLLFNMLFYISLAIISKGQWDMGDFYFFIYCVELGPQ